jgi:hypothetical protein
VGRQILDKAVYKTTNVHQQFVVDALTKQLLRLLLLRLLLLRLLLLQSRCRNRRCRCAALQQS